MYIDIHILKDVQMFRMEHFSVLQGSIAEVASGDTRRLRFLYSYF
jgi:hypothetical protein